MEFDILAFIIGAVLGGLIGYRVADGVHKAVMPDMFRRLGVTPDQLEQVLQDLQKEVNAEEGKDTRTEITIKVEQHGTQLYVFRKDTDEFLGQGKDHNEILSILQKKFKGVKFSVTEEDGAGLLNMIKNNPTS